MTSGDNSGENDTEPTVYAIRLLRRAAADIDAARDYIFDVTGEAIARRWREGLYEALAKLTRFPQGYSVATEENARVNEVLASQGKPAVIIRQTVYRRPGSGRQGLTYKVFFVVKESDDSSGGGGGGDAPFVQVVHVRHAARDTFTNEDAASLAGDME